MIDLIILICFEIILESENIKQDDVKAETKVECRYGARYCNGRVVCMCDWSCGCSDCSDEPAGCTKNGEIDEEYINRKYKENPETIPMIPEN